MKRKKDKSRADIDIGRLLAVVDDMRESARFNSLSASEMGSPFNNSYAMIGGQPVVCREDVARRISGWVKEIESALTPSSHCLRKGKGGAK